MVVSETQGRERKQDSDKEGRGIRYDFCTFLFPSILLCVSVNNKAQVEYKEGSCHFHIRTKTHNYRTGSNRLSELIQSKSYQTVWFI